MGANCSKFVEVAVQGHSAQSGRKVVNVFHYLRALDTVVVTKAAFWTAFDAALWSNVLAVLNADYIGEQVAIRNFDDPLDSAEIIDLTGDDGGNAGADPCSSFVCITVQMLTALRGRSYRGSKHFAIISSDNVTDNQINTGTDLTNWQNIRDDCLAGITVATTEVFLPCIFSKTLSPEPIDPATLVANVVTSVRLNKTVGTMRRRKMKTVIG